MAAEQFGQLKSLEIQGFKSFPDKTRLTFGKGITAVVGPNGSGKSNISDAVRWVMGEQSTKTLRSGKMEDVIFSGTVNRRPVGFAQVTLVIDNSDRAYDIESDEIAVTRRLYRSGESEYRINNAAVRLKDVNELFMDTGLGKDGYSIIGQGKIAEIVSAKSTQRREIFEEAAGISKYRYKKNESEHRLALAEENLLRLNDILSELQERVGPLEEQSKKAKRYLELAGNRKQLEISIWMQRLSEIRYLLKDLDDKLYLASANQEDLQKLLEQVEADSTALYDQMQQFTVQADECRRMISEAEEQLAQSKAQIAVWNNDIAHYQESIQRCEEQIASLTDQDADLRLEQLRGHMDELSKKRDSLQQEILDLQQSLNEEITTGQQTDVQQQEIAARINSMYQQLSDFKLRAATARMASSQFRAQLGDLEQSMGIRAEKSENILADIRQSNELLNEIAEKVQSLQNMQKGYQMKTDAVQSKYQAQVEQTERLDQQMRDTRQRIQLLTDLEKNMEGFSGSVKAVIRQSRHGELRGIFGTIAQLIQVPAQYSLAIETALGAAMQNIVVKNEDSAKQAIEYLKHHNAGRATFLPLTTVKGTMLQEPGVEDCDGYIGIASELVSCDEQYRPILRSSLGRTVVAQDLDCAVAIAKQYRYRFRLVTLDGQLVNAGGSLTGGSTQRNAGILSRGAEITRLEGQLKQNEAKLQELCQVRDRLKADLDMLVAQNAGLQSELNVANQDQVRFSAELELLEKQYKDLQFEQQRETAAKELLQKQLQLQEEEEQSLQEKDTLLQQEIQQLEQASSALSELILDASRRKEILVQRQSELQVESLNLDKDRELAQAELQHLLEGQMRVEEQKQKLQEQIAECDQAISDTYTMITEREELTKSENNHIQELRSEIVALSQQRQNAEHQSIELREREKEVNDQKNGLIRESVRLEERRVSVQSEYDNIISGLWDEYELTQSQAEEIATPIEDASKAQLQLNDLKNKIKALGHINLAAIEEYQEVSERYRFLKEQLEDVERSKAELKRLISDLTAQMRKQFSENFVLINQYFSSIFSELFEGGTGELKLTDTEDVLECGIEIHVQPPGKIIRNLASLSGGEQALVAIAIYFAILRVNPSPFCVLDEIEAALDDVNVGRYAAYLRRMSENTQFIVITHRRGTMEEADILYGVTMQDEGISKMLELNVSELESRMGKLG